MAKRTQIEIMQEVKDLRQERAMLESEIQDLQDQLNEYKQELALVKGELQDAEARLQEHST